MLIWLAEGGFGRLFPLSGGMKIALPCFSDARTLPSLRRALHPRVAGDYAAAACFPHNSANCASCRAHSNLSPSHRGRACSFAPRRAAGRLPRFLNDSHDGGPPENKYKTNYDIWPKSVIYRRRYELAAPSHHRRQRHAAGRCASGRHDAAHLSRDGPPGSAYRAGRCRGQLDGVPYLSSVARSCSTTSPCWRSWRSSDAVRPRPPKAGRSSYWRVRGTEYGISIDRSTKVADKPPRPSCLSNGETKRSASTLRRRTKRSASPSPPQPSAIPGRTLAVR
jgi:hypothetical protein